MDPVDHKKLAAEAYERIDEWTQGKLPEIDPERIQLLIEMFGAGGSMSPEAMQDRAAGSAIKTDDFGFDPGGVWERFQTDTDPDTILREGKE